MTTMTQPPADTRRVIGGIDTDNDVHVAVALDEFGRLQISCGSTMARIAGRERRPPEIGVVGRRAARSLSGERERRGQRGECADADADADIDGDDDVAGW
jgi:hypothetical protein